MHKELKGLLWDDENDGSNSNKCSVDVQPVDEIDSRVNGQQCVDQQERYPVEEFETNGNKKRSKSSRGRIRGASKKSFLKSSSLFTRALLSGLNGYFG
ncbi:hypothetical protein Hdeb2414_s0001g00035361 [Helianthus debilis subsp. tardiflorus]